MRIVIVLCVSVVSAVLGALAATPRQDAYAKDKGQGSEMSAADMAAMQKAGTPGRQQQELAGMVGSWKSEVTCTMKPGSPPMTSTGTDEFTMVMGDRFLSQEHTGSMMGEAFKGHGLYGFNNVSQQYESVWIDSMSTAIMTSQGSNDPAAKTITWNGEYQCPVNGLTHFRETLHKINDNEVEFTMYTSYGQTPEYPAIHIKYTRQ